MRRFLGIANGLISCCVGVALLVCVLYAGYALWDNEHVYAAAESVYEEMNQIMQGARAETDQDSDLAQQFKELQDINPDVTAWLTLPGTGIDYPLVQGANNLSYINTDVYGNFALAGSVYLDSRNSRDYSDIYSLVYGHNMSKHRMLSDINLFKDEAFFNENQTAMLLLPGQGHILQAVSYFLTTADNSTLFNPENWFKLDSERIYKNAQQDAMYINEEGLGALKAKLDAGEQPRLVALSTCSPESDDARTILLMLMDP